MKRERRKEMKKKRGQEEVSVYISHSQVKLQEWQSSTSQKRVRGHKTKEREIKELTDSPRRSFNGSY